LFIQNEICPNGDVPLTGRYRNL